MFYSAYNTTTMLRQLYLFHCPLLISYFFHDLISFIVNVTGRWRPTTPNTQWNAANGRRNSWWNGLPRIKKICPQVIILSNINVIRIVFIVFIWIPAELTEIYSNYFENPILIWFSRAKLKKFPMYNDVCYFFRDLAARNCMVNENLTVKIGGKSCATSFPFHFSLHNVKDSFIVNLA